MILKKPVSDSFLLGMLVGIITLLAFNFLINALRIFLVDYTGNPSLLYPPAVQLIALFLNMIFFRLVMVNLDREKTGKGILFITVLSALVYFLLRQQM